MLKPHKNSHLVSIEEQAIVYFELNKKDKLRRIADEHQHDEFIIMNGNRVLFKRQKFEEFLDKASSL
ncbi:MAG: transposase [Ruminococcus sp.]|nr:transposase [Ruminococcus sp.]